MTTETRSNNPTDLASIASQFTMNLRTLRVFNERIGAAAAEHDQSAVDSFMKIVKTLIPDRALTEHHEENQTNNTSSSEDNDGEKTRFAVHTDPQDDTENSAVALSPAKMEQLFKAAKSLTKAAPMQVSLLRRSVLISLISYLEALIADLIHCFYARFPQALPATDRTLSLAELREIGSIEEAEAFLTAKEVDSVLRDSLDTQLLYFAKRFRVELSALDDYRAITLEIDQRRNLFVHNKGVVNRIYLERVDSGLVKLYEARRDEVLAIKKEYLLQALNNVEVTGTVLLQQCWRKWDAVSRDTADSFLISDIFDALMDERYEIVERLAKYATTITFENEASKRVVCINHAIALRDSGRADEIESVLGQYDWSGYGLRFKVALSAVRGELEKLYDLLPRAIAAGELTKEELGEWPLFRKLRGTDRFNQELMTYFQDFGDDGVQCRAQTGDETV